MERALQVKEKKIKDVFLFISKNNINLPAFIWV